MRTPIYKFFFIMLISLAAGSPLRPQSHCLSLDPVPESINAIRFDPSYYYNAPERVNVLADKLAQQWRANGVNTVFYKAYDPAYGAKYRSDYDLNVEADYGRQNLLKYVIEACSIRGMQVMAWIPAFQHKGAWEKHPQWRVKNADGSDYRLNNQSYPLCAANPEVRTWWLGFLRDLLDNYPGLAGVDIGEPVVAWQTADCGCASCARQKTASGWNDISALELNKTLLAGFELIHSYKKIACVTSVVSPKADGALYTPAEQRGYTGFDLNALLDSENRPDWISLELMWQQWADLYQNPVLFSPDWIRGAAAIVKNQVAERSRLLAHLELTPFGRQGVSAAQLKQSMQAAKEADVVDIDLYDSHQIDRDEVWPTVEEGFRRQIVRRALIVSDPLGENDARQVAGLLSHFQTETEILLLREDGAYTPGKLENQDLLFYIGVDPKFRIPHAFLQEAAGFDGVLTWIHLGIDQYLKQTVAADYGFRYVGSAFDSSWNRVRYKSAKLFKQDPDFNRLLIQDSSRCKVQAWLENGNERLPYAVHSANLWYFADLTTAFVLEGGSYIVFADLLHEIVGQNHRSNPLAMVRIEDLSPLSDVVSLRRIADYLSSQDVPFSISLVPFYLDPANNTAASLSDQPEFVKTIQYMVHKGGVIVMHGNTHQYRGETTSDYEFWDMMNDGPLFSDSREYVRERLESGMEELAKNGLFPVTWETPHYGASQVDYAVINGYFSSAYERRQTIDLHGSDQLVPWMIYRHAAGGKIIPENLGYIPLSRQEAGSLLEAARNHLALRDGIASFFFHPFVDLNVLKEIIPKMKQMGYRFTDPRHTSQQVRGKTFRVLTGSGDIELPLAASTLREFYLDPHGAVRDETFSQRQTGDTLRRTITVPEGWIYVAQAVAAKPKGRVAGFLSSVINRMPRTTDYLTASQPLAVPNGQPIRMVLLYDREAKGVTARDQDNWQQALGSVGLDALRLQVDEFFTVPEGANLILVPHAASLKLKQQQILLLVRAVQNGANLILERPSNLSAAIGITLEDSLWTAASIADEYYPTVAIQWSSTDTMNAFETEYDYITYASEPVSGKPVVIGGDYGSGRYLYWATFFDPDSDGGFGRFPFVLEMLRYHFQLQPLIRRDAVEIYFDPGSREDISIEDLIKLWRQNGVRIINVAGWHSYRDYTYQYGRLIELAHLNAMSVYLWLELPHVSEKFWLDHPPWREKNALAADVDTSAAHWRRPMALNLADCREAVMAELRAILMAHDWDGINLAELYYESAAGPADPKWFTPMNSAFRQEFSRRHGFDPLSLFNPQSGHYWKQDSKAMAALYELRREQIIDQHRRFVEFFKKLEKEKNAVWKIIVTTLDDAMAADAAAHMAVNTSAIAALSRETPFTLQIEEPPQANPTDPQEYVEMIRHGQAYTQGEPLMTTINLAQRPEHIGLVTRQITGLELYRTIQQCQNHNAEVAFNSEAGLYDVDNGYLAMALASATRESLTTAAWHIDAATPVSLLLDGKRHQDVLVDGDVWPAYHRGRLLLPAGKHCIEPMNRTYSLFRGFWTEARLVALSGDLLAVKKILRGIDLRYRSETVNHVVLSEKPHAITVDGRRLRIAVTRGELGYAFGLPAGEHSAVIHTSSRTTQAIKQTSLALSGVIAAGGLVFGSILGFLYLKNSRLRRKKTKRSVSS